MSDTPKPNILDAMQEVEAAAEKATPRPWQDRFIYRMYRAVRQVAPSLGLLIGTPRGNDWPDARYTVLAANHAPDIIAFARRLLAVVRASVIEYDLGGQDPSACEADHLYIALDRDYPGVMREEKRDA